MKPVKTTTFCHKKKKTVVPKRNKWLNSLSKGKKIGRKLLETIAFSQFPISRNEEASRMIQRSASKLQGDLWKWFNPCVHLLTVTSMKGYITLPLLFDLPLYSMCVRKNDFTFKEKILFKEKYLQGLENFGISKSFFLKNFQICIRFSNMCSIFLKFSNIWYVLVLENLFSYIF